MNKQLTNSLYVVQCLQSFCCVYPTGPTVHIQNELRKVAEAILSI